MLVEIDDNDVLRVLPEESTQWDDSSFSAFCLLLSGIPIVFCLALKAYLLVLIFSPISAVFLTLAAVPLLASRRTSIDRRSGLIVAQRRWLRRRLMSDFG